MNTLQRVDRSQMTADDIFVELQAKIGGYAPAFELRLQAELAYEIEQLKRQRNAVILGHNYMEPALFHSVPDFVGDSLDLSRKAAQTEKDIIVFCGVKFMAETAKILNPTRTVLIPSLEAGCSLAASITAADVRALKARFPGVPVVSYVNTYADVKAESDICCTSGNAAAVVDSLGVDTVIFLPDEYLGGNVARELGWNIVYPDMKSTAKNAKNAKEEQELNLSDLSGLRGKTMIGWRGRCEVHEKFTVNDIQTVRAQFPDVAVLSHPECSPDVTAASDFSGSTNAIIKFVKESQAPQYLVLTECSMGDNIAAQNPQKDMLRLCMIRCPHMNTITMEDTLAALKLNRYVIEVPEDIRVRAARSVQRMIEIG